MAMAGSAIRIVLCFAAAGACLADEPLVHEALEVGTGMLVAALVALALFWWWVMRLRARVVARNRELAALREVEERWRSLVEAAPDTILVANRDRRVEYINRVVSGTPADQVIGHDLCEWVPDDMKERLRQGFERLFEHGEAFAYETESRGANGTLATYAVRIAPVRRGGVVSTALLVARDVTERRSSEQALRESEARYRQLVELSPDAIFLHTADTIVLANSTALRVLRAERADQVVGHDVFEFIHPDERETVRQRAAHTQQTGQSNPLAQRRMVALDGSEVTLETSSIAVRLADGRTAFQVVGRDITSRLAAEAALRDSEVRFRAIFETSVDAIAVSRGGVQVLTNESYARLFGYERREDLIGRPLLDFIAPSERPRVGEVARRRAAGEAMPSTYETRGLRQDGSEFDLDVHVSTFSMGGVVHTAGILRDITERRREAEARLRHETERLQLLERAHIQIERLQAACIVADEAHRVLSWNGAAERLFGWSRAEMLGRRAFEMMVPPEQMANFQGLFDRLRAGDVIAAGEGPTRTKDGRSVFCRWISTPIHASDGALVGVMSMAHDATEQRRLEEQLRHSQKMEAVGQLAGGVAHDFNNLLTVITGYGQMLLEAPELGQTQRRSAEQVLKAATRAAGLTKQLLAFSRRQVLQPKVLDLNEVVGDMEKLLRPLISEDIAVMLTLAPGLGRVRADPGQFEQVLMNLAVNARDALSGGGTLTIETANVDFAAGQARRPREIEPGHWVMLAVRDTGCGMDQATISHLFEPFFTTKEQGKGTGLGLATVYGIVKQSGGNILVTSEPGKGASFEIYLPRVDVPADAAPRAFDGTAGMVGDETVLLVEDDADVLELAKSALERGGYRVLGARDGVQALDLAARHQGEIHLALCDVIMPGLSGREVVERLRAARPKLRSMYMSGYADKAIGHKGMLAPGVVLIEKPFSAHALLRRVREVLDSAAFR
jgi:PAS domain S-box-containing protein